MEPTEYQLLLTLPDGTEKEYKLGKGQVQIGRATNNDIILPDIKVSRLHARIECGPAGCTILDLGSGNGLRLNGSRVEQAQLADQDMINLGDCAIQFHARSRTVEPDVTLIDSENDLDETLSQNTVAVALNEYRVARLAILSPQDTWELPLVGDAFKIGRSAENDIVLPFENTSRHHAVIERRGDTFWVKDLGSTNGIRLNHQRIEQAELHDGDTLQVGPTRLVYKGGFTSDELTQTSTDSLAQESSLARRPVVFVPGLMGSELWQGSEKVWPNVKILFTNPQIFSLDENSKLEAGGLVNEVVVVPNLIKSEQYNRLGDYLVEDLGYERGKDLLEFGYDWRKDVRQSALRLAEAIQQWNARTPVTIIAHSLGCLVTRYYVEKLGGKSRVERIVLLGGPHQGTPKAVTNLFLSADLLPFGLMGDKLRQVLSTFPSMYQILPTYQCTTDQDGQKIHLLSDESWVTETQRSFLHLAAQFRQELGFRSSVPAVSIFGYGIKTVVDLRIRRDADGRWQKMEFFHMPKGDSTIPETSAILEGSEIHPVQQYHGAIYVDNDVKMRLKLELTRS